MQFTHNFNEDTAKKYPDVIQRLSDENQKRDDVKLILNIQNLKSLVNKSKKVIILFFILQKETETKKKEEETEKKKEEDRLNKINEQQSIIPRWLKAIFGLTVFFGSSVGLFLLYKNRTRFYR